MVSLPCLMIILQRSHWFRSLSSYIIAWPFPLWMGSKRNKQESNLIDKHFSSLFWHYVFLYLIGQNKSHGQAQSQRGGKTHQVGIRRWNSLGAITVTLYTFSLCFQNRKEVPVIFFPQAYSQVMNEWNKRE